MKGKAMKKIKGLFIFVMLISVSVMAQTSTWDIDKAHSKIGFSVSHMVISDVTGKFNKFDGSVTTQGDDFTKGNIDITIDVASIDTDNDKRDAHLRSDDFFNAEKYPKIVFKGKSMKKVGKNQYKLTGDFTMRDVTKPVTLDVVHNGTIKDPYGNSRAGFKITGKVNRFDYNLKWNNMLETGGAVVGKDVNLICDIELVKASKEVGKK